MYEFYLREGLWRLDISSLVSTGVSDEEVESDEDDNHFLGHHIDPSCLKATGIAQDDDQPCTDVPPPNSMNDQELPCDPQAVSEKIVKDVEKESSRKNGIDYKSIWINNSLPCIVVEINSGKLLKGNTFFMKYVLLLHSVSSNMM